MAVQQTFEEYLESKMKGDALKNALDFVAYLKANDVTSDFNGFCYKGEGVCTICDFDEAFGEKFESPVPVIFFNGVCEPATFPVDEQIKEFAQANVHYCAYFTSNGKECGCGDRPGKRTAIFGKEFDHVCHSPLWFLGPDAEALENIKKLVEIRKHEIDENTGKS